MKPDFALCLSFEGISLLCRVEGGWNLLGEASLTSEDLGVELEGLRQMAEAIAGPDFRTKLVLPNDQIKYLTIETGKVPPKQRRAQAREELEATTPYQADELSFVIAPERRLTHVAAVARETLVEAETFAKEHAFNPVCFVAIPDDEDFPREPFFGPTEIAGELLGRAAPEAEVEPIRIIGTGAPDPAPEEAPVEEIDTAAFEDAHRGTPPVAAQPELPLTESVESDPEPVVEDEDPAEPAKPEEPEAAPIAFGSRRSAPQPAPAVEGPSVNDGTVPAASLAPSKEDAELRFDPARIAAGLRATAKDDLPPAPAGSEETVAETPATFTRSRDNEGPRAPRIRRETVTPADPEHKRMAIFGARDGMIGGKPRFLGLLLTVLLIVFLAAVAVWASLFLEGGVAGLFRRDPPAQIADTAPESQPTPGLEIVAPDAETVEVPDLADSEMETALLEPVGTDSITDSAEIEAMTDDVHPTAPTEQEAEARYAVTGIWERAPEQAVPALGDSTDSLYPTSIDSVQTAQDAIALPALTALQTDRPAPRVMSPLPADQTFDLDENGLVVATRNGAMSPDGIRVFLGKPVVLPAAYPKRQPAPGETLTPEDEARISKIRPRLRPSDLIEQNERANNGGRTIAELGKIRPRLRPESAKFAEEKDTTPNKMAVLTSVKPRVRPSNFSQIVARATPSEPVAAVPVAATVTPKIPTTASVARQATIQNAIKLNKINLIGVYGTSSDRRALVRLSNGRYKKVQVGDRIDGGKVSAIGETELRYVKSGRNVVLKMPKG
ncbi:hypothetical protein NNA36_05290 [Shimia sp. CNT1-13L.2]|uniref:hypothetical protein n=1 Tax=Shimia sp. CNT1-13L.2 TaxID=2959663 RepID=UPI0020CCEDCA|nr:hypothetical protein [Shimia sp. CNT1-13L.2]MCP9481368.1 hypothetical protein [Shimia sp. CNT1-13L.2]